MYNEKTGHFRNDVDQVNGNLLISFIKPHKKITKDTIANWIRIMLNRSGLDTRKYSVGGVQPAAAWKAKAMAVLITHIMAKAGWLRETTFAKQRRLFRSLTHYKKLYWNSEYRI